MTPSAYAPYEIRLWPNATGMAALRSVHGQGTPHPALRATFSPLRGEKGKHRGLVRQVRETGAVCRDGGLSTVAVASGRVRRQDVRALTRAMCDACRRRARLSPVLRAGLRGCMHRSPVSCRCDQCAAKAPLIRRSAPPSPRCAGRRESIVSWFAKSVRQERCAVAAACRRSLSHPGCFVVRMCGRLRGRSALHFDEEPRLSPAARAGLRLHPDSQNQLGFPFLWQLFTSK